MPTHILFIDDSGTKEYADDPRQYGSGNSRYFVFAGMLAPLDAAARLSGQISSLKLSVFKTADVEIKSNWLRMPQERQKRYLDKYGITDEQLRTFTDDLYTLVCNADLLCVAGVVDKQQMQATYKKNLYYPPAVAYELLLQRVQQELEGKGTVAVTVDDITGKTPKQTKYKSNLQAQHERLKKHGSSLQRGFAFSAVTGRIRFMNSAHSNLVQVADLVAYNVFRQFVAYGDAWEDVDRESLPTYEYFQRICTKFRTDGEGRIQGYGVGKMPPGRRVHWTISAPPKSKAAP